MQINRTSLADGLAQLGFNCSDSDVERLLEQLASVPGMEDAGDGNVSGASLAASQLDWEQLQVRSFSFVDVCKSCDQGWVCCTTSCLLTRPVQVCKDGGADKMMCIQ